MATKKSTPASSKTAVKKSPKTKATAKAKTKAPAKASAKAKTKAPAKTSTIKNKVKAPTKTKTSANAKAKTKVKAPANKITEAGIKGPAQCVFDLYDLRFGMTRDEVSKVLDYAESGHLKEEALLKIGAEMVELFFDHLDRLWQVKALYIIKDIAEAEELLDRMSKDYRFQTPTSRVAFETDEGEPGHTKLSIRYTEINFKRMYLHHMMAVGAAKIAEAEELERAIKEKEEEEYIPTGPMMF